MATKPPFSGLITPLFCVFIFLSAGAAFSSPLPDSDISALRAKLAARGLTFGFTYIGELSSDVAGGLHRKAVYLDNISLTLTFDLNKILGWRGATFYVYGMSFQGRSPSRNMGDAQGVSNIAAYPTSRLYEAWVQQDLFADRLSLLAGIYDLNSEFAVIEAAGVFLNSSRAVDFPLYNARIPRQVHSESSVLCSGSGSERRRRRPRPSERNPAGPSGRKAARLCACTDGEASGSTKSRHIAGSSPSASGPIRRDLRRSSRSPERRTQSFSGAITGCMSCFPKS